jgi:hypothetical protein
MNITPRAFPNDDSGTLVGTAEPPCDFDTFVAQRRGIGREQAEQLVQSWLVHYCPRHKPAINIGAESNGEEDAESYDIGARGPAPTRSEAVAHVLIQKAQPVLRPLCQQ